MSRHAYFLDPILAIFTALIGSFLSWYILMPQMGIDDANITMNFAQNIANGAGYVYYIGGERVEGSTSALWTLINTIAYLFFDEIEVPLAALGLLICTVTIYASFRLTRLILLADNFQDTGLVWLLGVMFLLSPAFYAYVVWSLLDIGLFIMLVAVMFLSLCLQIHNGATRFQAWLFIICAALLTATRPEGVAVACGLSFLLWVGLIQTGQHYLSGIPLRAALAAIIVTIALVGLRMWYFGQPLPNTFYAKVSTSYVDQIIAGIKYTLSYTHGLLNLIMLSLFLLAMTVFKPKRGTTLLWLAALACIAGCFAIYSVLGGDHFGSYRFYQVLTPILLPWAVATMIILASATQSDAVGWRFATMIAACLVLLFGVWSLFERNKGGLNVEFRLAEDGRAAGALFNDFDYRPSVGIIAAGGVAMTYDGPIYDLLGLNWVEMAQSNRSAMRVKNNSGFSEEVFWSNPPDVLLPEKRACDLPPVSYQWVMDEVVKSERFQDMYRYDCYKSITFYIKKDLQVPSGT